MMKEEKKNVDLDEVCDEIWESIFANYTLCYTDIISISLTCKRLSKICVSESIWKRMRSRRWGTTDVKWDGVSSYRLFKRRHIIEKKLKHIISKIGRETYCTDGISNCYVQQLLSLVASKNEILLVLKSLKYFIENCSKDLNLQYLSTKLHMLVHQHILKNEWKLCSSGDSYCLEEGAVFISKWCNQWEDISIKSVSIQLDNISKRIAARLPKEFQSNSSQFTEDHVKIILSETNHVLFEEMKFEGNTEDYYDVNNSYINKVFETKKGIPITLSIIYMAVTRRLGLKPQSINFPGHFLIRFEIGSSGKSCRLYVDAFHGGEILDKSQCIEKFYNRNIVGPRRMELEVHAPPEDIMFPVVKETKVFIRQITNIINIYREDVRQGTRHRNALQSCLELSTFLVPGHLDSWLSLTRIYLEQGINLDEVVEIFKEMMGDNGMMEKEVEKRKTELKMEEPKYRSTTENSDVLYRVGMVMKHRRYHYNCVIYGWDPCCKSSKRWKIQMGVYNLEKKDQQPFYHVLGHDGTTRYASQENIYPLSSSVKIGHEEVGKHFKSFDGSSYIATDTLSTIYPEDQPLPL